MLAVLLPGHEPMLPGATGVMGEVHAATVFPHVQHPQHVEQEPQAPAFFVAGDGALDVAEAQPALDAEMADATPEDAEQQAQPLVGIHDEGEYSSLASSGYFECDVASCK